MKKNNLLSTEVLLLLLLGIFTNTSAQTKTGLNPAHGAPGHRCDIAVGSPLNSVPLQNLPPGQPFPGMLANPPKSVTPKKLFTNTTSGAVQQAIAPSQTAKATAETKSANKVPTSVNPPHGQPNHRCDIAVGAPLNSNSGKPLVASVKRTKSSTTDSSKITSQVKVNPPHGQPGHDCSVEVGKPLKQ